MDYSLIQKSQSEITPDINLLDAGERARYDRLLLPQKQLEFLTGRTLLKNVLADYTSLKPQSILVGLTATGKPYLVATTGKTTPYFSLSHAAGHYVVGISPRPIGVDTEPWRPVDLRQLRPFLHPDEFEALLTLPESEQPASFLRLFTAKEALLKATDKRWSLDEICFRLDDQEWRLNSPTFPCSILYISHKAYCTAVCLDLSDTN